MTTIINVMKLAVALYRGYWFVRWSVNASAIWFFFNRLVAWSYDLAHGLGLGQGIGY